MLLNGSFNGPVEVPLSQIQSCDRKLTLISNGKQCDVNILLAFATCHAILIDSWADCCLNKVYEVHGASDGDLEKVATFINTLECDVGSTQDALYLYEMAARLGCTRLAAHVAEFFTNRHFLSAGLDYLKMIYELGGNCAPFVEFWAEQMRTAKPGIFAKLPIPLLDMIFKNAQKVVSPERILEVLQAVFDWRKEPNHRLAKYLPLRVMSEQDRHEFLHHPMLNLNRLKGLLLSARTYVAVPVKKSEAGIEVKYDQDNPFAGFLAMKKFYTLDASSVATGPNSYDPEVMLSEQGDDYFCTNADLDPYLIISMTDARFTMTGYSLQTWRMGANGVVPVDWEVWGSKDGESWDLLDRRENQRQLIGNSVTAYFDVEMSPAVRDLVGIKFIQKKNANPGNTRLALAHFEVFGSYELA